MPNSVAGELNLSVGSIPYTLKFTNRSYVELEEYLRGRELDSALGRGLNMRVLARMFYVATRRYHAEELPSFQSVVDAFDEIEDLHGLLFTLITAYSAGQPKPIDDPADNGGESFSSKDNKSNRVKEEFSWRGFLTQAVNAGLKPEEFWNMSPDEAALWINGYQKRQESQGEMWAHFNAALMNNSRTRKDKKVKPKDLWQTQGDKRKSPADVISIDERRSLMRELKGSIKPPVPKRKRDEPEA